MELNKKEMYLSPEAKIFEVKQAKNICIERIWKTIKYEYIYIQPEDTGSELYHGIKSFVDDYNHHRRHQVTGHMVPGKIYLKEVA